MSISLDTLSSTENDLTILGWAAQQSWNWVNLTRDANGAPQASAIIWFDGTTGYYTPDALSADFPGATDAWHVTYVSNSGTRTITQSLVNRDSTGAVVGSVTIVIA